MSNLVFENIVLNNQARAPAAGAEPATGPKSSQYTCPCESPSPRCLTAPRNLALIPFSRGYPRDPFHPNRIHAIQPEQHLFPLPLKKFTSCQREKPAAAQPHQPRGLVRLLQQSVIYGNRRFHCVAVPFAPVQIIPSEAGFSPILRTWIRTGRMEASRWSNVGKGFCPAAGSPILVLRPVWTANWCTAGKSSFSRSKASHLESAPRSFRLAAFRVRVHGFGKRVTGPSVEQIGRDTRGARGARGRRICNPAQVNDLPRKAPFPEHL